MTEKILQNRVEDVGDDRRICFFRGFVAVVLDQERIGELPILGTDAGVSALLMLRQGSLAALIVAAAVTAAGRPSPVTVAWLTIEPPRPGAHNHRHEPAYQQRVASGGHAHPRDRHGRPGNNGGGRLKQTVHIIFQAASPVFQRCDRALANAYAPTSSVTVSPANAAAPLLTMLTV